MTPGRDTLGHTYLMTLESWSPFKTLKKQKRKRTALERGRTCTQSLDIVLKSADVITDTWELRRGTKDWLTGTQR